jgi:hypothetical protein
MKQPKPKTPAKKYTPQDSVNYRRMNDRQFADENKAFQNFPKMNQPALNRIARRDDSMSNSPYFKAKAKVEVKNGVTSRTLTETTKKAKSTKPAPAKPMTKAKSKSMPVKKTMAKSTKK